MLEKLYKSIGVAFLIAALGVPIYAVQSSSVYQKCKSENAENASTSQQEQNSAGIVAILTQGGLTIFKCAGVFAKKYDAAITAIATALLTFVTCGLVLIWYMQINTTRAQLRAYVYVFRAEIINVTTEGKGVPEAKIFIKNYGQTPARKMINVTGLRIVPYIDHPTVNLTISTKKFANVRKTRMDLAPSDSFSSVTPWKRPLTDEEKRLLADKKLIVYVHGEIHYRDIFRRKQWTKYRLMTGGPAGVCGSQLTGCEEGNEAT